MKAAQDSMRPLRDQGQAWFCTHDALRTQAEREETVDIHIWDGRHTLKKTKTTEKQMCYERSCWNRKLKHLEICQHQQKLCHSC